MSFTRDRGFIVFQCDQCKETHETGTVEFNRAKDRMKDLEWSFRPDRGNWLHFCSDACRGAWRVATAPPVAVNGRQYWEDRD